jgi:hypothetical protein
MPVVVEALVDAALLVPKKKVGTLLVVATGTAASGPLSTPLFGTAAVIRTNDGREVGVTVADADDVAWTLLVAEAVAERDADTVELADIDGETVLEAETEAVLEGDTVVEAETEEDTVLDPVTDGDTDVEGVNEGVTLLDAVTEGVMEGEVDGVGTKGGPGSVPLPTIVTNRTAKPGSLVARAIISFTTVCTKGSGTWKLMLAWVADKDVLVTTLAKRRE